MGIMPVGIGGVLLWWDEIFVVQWKRSIDNTTAALKAALKRHIIVVFYCYLGRD